MYVVKQRWELFNSQLFSSVSITSQDRFTVAGGSHWQ